MILLILFVGAVALSVMVWKVVQKSKLSEFNQSSLLFRIAYALFTSPAGQYIHEAMIYTFKYLGRNKPHTALSTSCDLYLDFSVSYVPFLLDNYAYFIVDRDTGDTAVVDPGDPALVLQEFNRLQDIHQLDKPLHLTMILCTHHHMDHAGGNTHILGVHPNVRVVSGVHETVAAQNEHAQHGDVLQLGAHTHIQILETPCHTRGHVVFYVTSSSLSGSESEHQSTPLRSGSLSALHTLHSHPSTPTPSPTAPVIMSPPTAGALFTGDTLFLGGCGKFFEGSGEWMERSLYRTIRPLPPQSRIYCGHEYAVSNLEFGLLVEPDNSDMLEKLIWARQKRSMLQATIPSTLQEECSYNVYLRADSESVLFTLFGENEGGGGGVSGVRGLGASGSSAATETTTLLPSGRKVSVSEVLEMIRRWKDTKIQPVRREHS